MIITGKKIHQLPRLPSELRQGDFAAIDRPQDGQTYSAKLKDAIVNNSSEDDIGLVQMSVDMDTYVLPINFPKNTEKVFLDLNQLDEDIDLTNWKPTGLKNMASVRVRKIDNSQFKIKFSDGICDYEFLDRKGEIIELVWIGDKFKI